MAQAVMAVLRRDLVPIRSWSRGSAGSPGWPRPTRSAAIVDPYAATNNSQQLLRALYLQLALAADPPADRADLILVTVDALRATNPFTLGGR